MNFTTTFLRITVLVLLLAIGLAPDLLYAQQFAGGIGTQSSPYQIATATHLDNARNFTSAHFRHTTDIELTLYNHSSKTNSTCSRE
ncbi:MAG: hypothetical protein MI700_04180 [Balneolales bacterium]|nr:hypothetical protein [Balneolales bacterium]